MGLTSFLWAKDGVGTFLYIILLLFIIPYFSSPVYTAPQVLLICTKKQAPTVVRELAICWF